MDANKFLLGAKGMKVAIAICSVSRPDILMTTLRRLATLVPCPDDVVLVVSEENDLPDLTELNGKINVQIAFSMKGLTRQRNCAIQMLSNRSDILFFIDDDYWPALNAVKGLKSVFERNPDVVGVTGQVLLDGISEGGLGHHDALKALDRFDENARDLVERETWSLYGCNMAFRTKAIGVTRFDENLPLYGWQEDVDFSARLPGKKLYSNRVSGVHLGVANGRETSGARLGYSQVANVIYLWRKGSLPTHYAMRQVTRNLGANFIKILWSEGWIDRRSRAFGNIWAIWDLFLGRIHPTRAQKIAPK